ncbi:endonuclease domain-containing protein, partial [Corynebacterium sp.]|uniref:endonuclease domain-containing protein n=1 Tax=Corynebacterium sp. TaxID=1720 RepID=UPI0026DC9BF7
TDMSTTPGHRYTTLTDATRIVDGFRVHHPLLVLARAPRAEGIELCETLYSSARGRKRLEEDRRELKQMPKASQAALSQAVLFTDSGAEIKVARALKALGIDVECNVFIGAYLWDIVLPKQKIAVEINGIEFHSALHDWIRDHWKNNEAVLRGWRTLRYTGHCVAHHLSEVVEQISTAKEPDWSSYFYQQVSQWHRALLPREYWDFYG